MLDTQIYEVELWSRQGVLVADISVLVKTMSFTQERNASESFEMTLDLDAFEDLASSIGTMPMVMLNPYRTDIKVKRRGVYLFGVHVVEVNTELNEDESTISIRAVGYLDLLNDRFITKSYTNEYETDIIQDLINETQSQTNGDIGITFGTQVQLVQRDRIYERQNIKEAIINLTKLVTGNFDFAFDHNKVFSTYEMIGSDRSIELEFTYPGNIRQLTVPRTGINLFNKIYGLGAGFGDDQVQSLQADTDSQLEYGVHESIYTWNSVIEQATLDQNAQARLILTKNMLEIPQIKISGRDFDLSTYGIGDRVTVRVLDHNFLNTIDGVYRIERISVSIDENQDEDITLFFDNNQLEALNDE